MRWLRIIGVLICMYIVAIQLLMLVYMSPPNAPLGRLLAGLIALGVLTGLAINDVGKSGKES